MNLMDLFNQNVHNFPDNPALSMSSRNETWTYQDLNNKVCQLAHNFKKEGIEKGDGVLILVPMSFELYTTLLALFKIGAVAVFIDPQSSKKHIKNCISKYPLKAFVGVKKAHLLRIINKDIRQIPLQFTVGYLPLTQNINNCFTLEDTTFDNAIINDNDPALITFTSGSTGLPKVAVRTHLFLLKQYEVLSNNMLFNVGEIDISTLPVFVLANLAAGMHSVIPNINLLKPALANGTILLNDIVKYKATRFGGSPALVKKLTHSIVSTKQIRLTHVYMGGGPVYPLDLLSLQDKIPETQVFGLYGSTEAEPIAHMLSYEYTKDKISSTKNGNGLYVGTPIDEIEIKIIDSDKLNSNLEDISSIESIYGEIIVKGEHVLKGYLNGEGDKENKIHINGEVWHRTGDAGYFDSNKELWLLGRDSQKIKLADKVLYPFAVEAALYEQGYETALIKHNNRITLVSTKHKPEQEILDSFNIEDCIIVDSIPRDKRHNAKIDYTELKNIIDK